MSFLFNNQKEYHFHRKRLHLMYISASFAVKYNDLCRALIVLLKHENEAAIVK